MIYRRSSPGRRYFRIFAGSQMPKIWILLSPRMIRSGDRAAVKGQRQQYRYTGWLWIRVKNKLVDRKYVRFDIISVVFVTQRSRCIPEVIWLFSRFRVCDFTQREKDEYCREWAAPAPLWNDEGGKNPKVDLPSRDVSYTTTSVCVSDFQGFRSRKAPSSPERLITRSSWPYNGNAGKVRF